MCKECEKLKTENKNNTEIIKSLIYRIEKELKKYKALIDEE